MHRRAEPITIYPTFFSKISFISIMERSERTKKVGQCGVEPTTFALLARRSYMRGSRKFCQRWSNITFDKGKEDPNSTKSGPSSARQQYAIKMAFHWRANDGPTLNAVLAAL